jgi:hypothetical protein
MNKYQNKIDSPGRRDKKKKMAFEGLKDGILSSKYASAFGSYMYANSQMNPQTQIGAIRDKFMQENTN